MQFPKVLILRGLCLSYVSLLAYICLLCPLQRALRRLDYNYPPAEGDIDHPGSYDYDAGRLCKAQGLRDASFESCGDSSHARLSLEQNSTHEADLCYEVVFRVVPGFTFEMAQAGKLSPEVEKAAKQV